MKIDSSMSNLSQPRLVVIGCAIACLGAISWISIKGRGHSSPEAEVVDRFPRPEEIELSLILPESKTRVKLGDPIAFRGLLRGISAGVRLRKTDPLVIANEMLSQGRFVTLGSFPVTLTRRADGAFEFQGTVGAKAPATKPGPHRIRAVYAGALDQSRDKPPGGKDDGRRATQPRAYAPYEVTP